MWSQDLDLDTQTFLHEHHHIGSSQGPVRGNSLSVTHRHHISSLSTDPRKAWPDVGTGVAAVPGPMFGVTQCHGVMTTLHYGRWCWSLVPLARITAESRDWRGVIFE